MSKWSRVYKSDTHEIYMYVDNLDKDTYKVHAYKFYRRFIGEEALKNAIQYINDFGDYGIDQKLIKQTQDNLI